MPKKCVGEMKCGTYLDNFNIYKIILLIILMHAKSVMLSFRKQLYNINYLLFLSECKLDQTESA